MPAERRLALVIGNSAYKEAPLRNPVNDATDVAAALRALGFSVTLRTDVDNRQMRTAIREFAQDLKRGGVGLFYFAGHGIQARGKNYLIPIAADFKQEFELEDEAVDANRVLAGMEEAGNQINIVILDACRNNPFARSWRSASNGLAQMSAPTGSFLAFATAPGSVAADGSGRNGIFTKNLLEQLRQGDADIDKVFTHVTAGVSRETGGRQVPWKSSSLTSEFYFRPGATGSQASVASAPAMNPLAIELAFWDSVRNSSNPADYQEYLNQYPDGSFAGLARNRMRLFEPTQVASAARDSAVVASAVASPPPTFGSMPAQPAAMHPQPEQAPWQPAAMQPPPVAVASVTPACRECGTLESVREIVKEASGPGIGAVLGALGGALVGRQVASGSNRTAGLVIGALGGAFAGNQVERAVAGTKAYEVTVRFEDGISRNIVQDVPLTNMRPGDRVRVMNGVVGPMW